MTGWGNATGLDKFPWDSTSKARVKALWADGESAGQIACAISAEFGRRVERNAVIGIIHRGKFESPMSKKPVDRSRKTPRRAPARMTYGPELPDITLPPAEGDAIRAFGRPVRLLDLGANACRWPLGDVRESGGVTFCNAAQYQSGPYCVPHMRCGTRPGAYRE